MHLDLRHQGKHHNYHKIEISIIIIISSIIKIKNLIGLKTDR